MLLQVAPNPAVLRRPAFFAIGLCLFSFVSTAGSAAAQAPNPSVLPRSYGLLPLAFEANRGQTGPGVRFVARGEGYSLLIGESEAVLSLHDSAACTTANSQARRVAAKCMPRSERLRMRLVDAGAENAFPVRSGRAEATGESLLPGRVNYLIGNDPAKWRTGVPTYRRVRLIQVYPGVDLLYYGNQRRLEYDFEVAPGADPRAIRMHFDGADLKLDPKGNLEIALTDGKVVFERPVIYQDGDGGRRTVSGDFRLLDHSTMGFRLGAYDRSRPLIIDPVLSYSTFVDGGTITAVAVDTAGNAYVTGAGEQITTTAGAFQGKDNNTSGYGGNAFVTKLDPTGTTAVYSTYIGGSGQYPDESGPPPSGAGDGGAGIAVDSAGNAYLTGFTYSPDFPVKNAVQPGNNATRYGNDNAFVAELNPAGSALVYSTYLGGSGCGNGEGDGGTGLALDAMGAVYIVGITCSPDFPTTAGVFQPSSPASFDTLDAFVAKISPGGASLVYSTYLAGSGGAYGAGVAVDGSGNVYVTGTTYSTDFPVTTGAYQSKDRAGNGTNAFVTKLNPAGSAPVYSTYLGGTGGGTYTNPLGNSTLEGDGGNGIAVDSAGNAYVTGIAGSTDFPVTSGAFQPKDGAALGVPNAFITKLNATGSALVYSTYLGGSGGTGHAQSQPGIGDSGIAIAVDSAGNAYVAGAAGSTDFPVTAGAVQTVNHAAASGSTNAFVAQLNPAGTGLLYSTYLGGSGTVNYSGLDYATGVAQNGVGKIYVAGIADSPDFPTSAGAYQTTGVGGFASMLDLGIAGAAELSIAPGNLTVLSPAVGQASAAKTVTLTNGGTGAVTIQNIGIGGINAAEFTQTNTCGSSLLAGDACTVSITLTPTVAGSRSASLSITDDAPGSPQSIPLTGNEIVYPPNASFSPTLLTFSLQAVGTISAPQTATLTNTGQGPLNITSISLGGPILTGNGGNQADSYFTQANNCGSTLAAGASCTFHVTFTPPVSGQINDGVSVQDNQGNSPQILGLTGTGAIPAMTLSAMSLTFASQGVGSTSGAQNVTLTNTGQVPVTIASIAVTGDFSETNSCGGTIAVSGNCIIAVTFMPTTTGSRTGTIAINDNASGSPQAITLTGTGIAPAVTLSTTSLTFSAQTIGSTSAAQMVQLTNSGQAVLNIASIAASGDFATQSACGSTLAAGAHCTISATFTPTAAGNRQGQITIADNASGSPQMVSLTGAGVSPTPVATLTPASVTFAAQPVGSTSSAQTITLTNTGSAAMNVASIAASGDFAETNACGASLAVATNCAITVTFTPTAAGSRTGTLTVTDNASGSPQSVALTGTGSSVALSASSASLNISSPGGSATDTIQISSAQGFSGTVNLTCTVTYQGTGTAKDSPACTLNPATGQVSTNSSLTSTLTVSTTGSGATAQLNQSQLNGSQLKGSGPNGIWLRAGASLAALFFIGFLPRRRWKGTTLLLFLVLTAACATVGCGGSSTPPNQGTTTGSYQVVVTATSSTVTASTTIALTLQ